MDRAEPDWIPLLLDWLRARMAPVNDLPAATRPAVVQGLLWSRPPYEEDRPSLRDAADFESALEHLDFAVHRRYRNQLTRAERARLDNTIQNARYKLERYIERLGPDARPAAEAKYAAARELVQDAHESQERLRLKARRAELKLSQLGSLTPEGFEEFVAELFEALGHDVERCGGTGDDGADLRLSRDGLLAVVQCKYHRAQGVVGSPELRRFLGTIHHMRCHKGYLVTTSTFSLSAERFAADHPIELVDGPRLVEFVEHALGPAAHKDRQPSWF